jgi:hypothetical protein
MAMPFLDPARPLLDHRFPLPLEEPFTGATARAHGIHSVELSRLVALGLVRRLVRGVYVANQVADALELRVAALRLVVPPGAVVTDRTAGWLHGADMVLAPGDHLVVPPVSVFHVGRGCRVRTDLVASGQRMMPEADITDVDGLRVTTPLRTACDLGRLLKRAPALAALDAMLRLGTFSKDELLLAAAGFRGYRWVRQLRALAPITDRRAESPPESILRLRWLDCSGMPRPEPQRPVSAPSGVVGGFYFVDLGVDELQFGVEYDGEEAHGPAHATRDADRRAWITEQERWVLRVVRRRELFGPRQRLEAILREGLREARATIGERRRSS